MEIKNKKTYLISLSILILLVFTCLGAVNAADNQTNNTNVLTDFDTIQNDNGSDINVLLSSNVKIENLESSDTVNLLGSSNGIYYVNNETGKDDGTYDGLSASTPFATISKAVSTIETDEYSGGTFVVSIAPGTYQLTSTIPLLEKNINFTGT